MTEIDDWRECLLERDHLITGQPADHPATSGTGQREDLVDQHIGEFTPASATVKRSA